MAGLLRAYVHHCHRRHGFVGHRWQGRFKSPAAQCRDYSLRSNPEGPTDREWFSTRRSWSKA
jgi:hypothetical protein